MHCARKWVSRPGAAASNRPPVAPGGGLIDMTEFQSALNTISVVPLAPPNNTFVPGLGRGVGESVPSPPPPPPPPGSPNPQAVQHHVLGDTLIFGVKPQNLFCKITASPQVSPGRLRQLNPPHVFVRRESCKEACSMRWAQTPVFFFSNTPCG